MSWSVIGKIGLTEAFPATRASFIGHAMEWRYQPFSEGERISELVANSPCSLGIYKLEVAKDILSNLLEKGSSAAEVVAGEATFSFVWFNYDPELKLGSTNFVIGLNDPDWDVLAPNLRSAMIHREQFRLNAQGYLANSDVQNDLDIPTPDEFETGKARGLVGVSVRLLNEDMLK